MRRHYWDHTDFRDESLLNNPFWPTFFDNYFDRFVTPVPDSITAAVDEVLRLMPKDGAFHRFGVLRFVQSFEMSDSPGADLIFVHMVDHYLKVKETTWLDIATLTRLEYKADILRPVLTGKTAPALELSDEKGRPFRLDTVAARLTLLIFYSPLCSHCMTVMPDIYQTWLDAHVFGVQAVAVSVDEQYRNWQQFVRQQNWEWHDLADPAGKNSFEKLYPTNNLPVIYLLDKDKHILRKRIKPEDLRDVLKLYLNNLK
jgi:peroxiredoxin